MSYKKILEKKKTIPPQRSVTRLHIVSYRIFGDIARPLYPRLSQLETTINNSMLGVPFQVYVCTMLMVSMISGIASAMMTFIGSQTGDAMSTPVTLIFTIGFGLGVFSLAFGILYIVPSFLVKLRAQRLADELPHFIGYMSTLASSKQTLEDIFKIIAMEDSQEEIVKDARYVVRNIEVFGMDMVGAIKDLRSKTPFGAYLEMLDGAISTFQTGGSLKEFFNATAKVQLEERKINVKKSIDALGIISEIYTVLLVVFPLLTIIMLSVMSIMTTSLMGFDLPTLISLITFGILPLCGVLMIIMMDSMIPKR
ncbi:MAG: type II secretion system F family protein [Candidatus Nitrosotenuis sp.]